MSASAPYVELHAHSAFSFLDGASTPLELAEAAEQLGYPAFALTDHDGIWGSREFAESCAGLRLRPITGAELSVALPPARAAVAAYAPAPHRQGVAGPGRFAPGLVHLTLLVEDAVGYRNLCRLLTAAHAHTRDGPGRVASPPWATLEQLEEHAAGLVCLSGCARDGALAGAFERGDTARGERLGRRLLAAFGRERFRVELQRPCWRRDRARNRWLALLAERLGVACVATGNVHCHDPGRARLQDALVAIGLGQTLEESEPRRRGNRSSALVSPATMATRFAAHPEAVAETLRLAERLEFDLATELGYRYPREGDPGADRELGELCRARLAVAYAGRRSRRRAETRLGEELATIHRLDLAGFFLLHHELLELAREVAREVRGEASARALLPPGRGRGSSVSSIVCYLTGLSHVDPVEKELFSGRFLNDEAQTMPDIDLDFPRDVREALIPRVHQVYGAERSALVAAFPTYRPRGAVRDLGKALGLPPAEVEGVAAATAFHGSADELEGVLAAALGPARAAAPRWRALLACAGEVLGLPRHPSQHSGGMVISTEPLVDVCPIVPTAMAGRQIVQWDKDSCADAGLLKIDLLGLGMLSAVERCVEEVERTRGGERLDLSRIPLDDERVYESIRAAETTGVFQIESRAQMQMLPRTRPRNLDDLTVQVALVRPGPIQGGAVHPYIERRRVQRRCEDAGQQYQAPCEHPALQRALRETLGTIVFQEQVLEVAIDFAGFRHAEAEQLRRAMSRERSEREIERQHRRFVAGAVAAHGVDERLAERVWEQVRGFAGFGFPKAHSAAFGLLVYQSAWLRVHRAPEFLCALLNEQPMGFYPPDALVHEARRRGVRVAGPDVNRSRVACHAELPGGSGRRAAGGRPTVERSTPESEPEDEPLVRIGLGYVKGARRGEMEALVAERERGGPYRGVADLASRSGAGLAGLERLAFAGALDSLPASTTTAPVSARSVPAIRSTAPSREGRREALWRVGVLRGGRGEARRAQLALPLEPPAPPPLDPLGEWGELIADYRSTGIALGGHPMALIRPGLDPGLLRSDELRLAEDGAAVEIAGLVVARQRPQTAKGIVFMTIEDELGIVNAIVPGAVYERHRATVRSAVTVRASGRLERRDGVMNVLISAIEPLGTGPAAKASAPLKAASRATPRSPAGDTDPPGPLAPWRAARPTPAGSPPHVAAPAPARALALAELRAVVPAGHSFGRRAR